MSKFVLLSIYSICFVTFRPVVMMYCRSFSELLSGGIVPLSFLYHSKIIFKTKLGASSGNTQTEKKALRKMEKFVSLLSVWSGLLLSKCIWPQANELCELEKQMTITQNTQRRGKSARVFTISIIWYEAAHIASVQHCRVWMDWALSDDIKQYQHFIFIAFCSSVQKVPEIFNVLYYYFCPRRRWFCLLAFYLLFLFQLFFSRLFFSFPLFYSFISFSPFIVFASSFRRFAPLLFF